MWQKKITFTCSMCMHNEQLNSKRTIKKHKIFNNIAIQCSRNVNHWNGTLTFRITTTHNFYAFSIEKKQDLSRDMNKNKTPCPLSFLFPVPFAFWPCDLWVMHHYIVAIESVPFILVTVVVFWVGGIQGSETGRHCQSTLTASLQSVMVISKNVSYQYSTRVIITP